jgi:hypothetical protein
LFNEWLNETVTSPPPHENISNDQLTLHVFNSSRINSSCWHKENDIAIKRCGEKNPLWSWKFIAEQTLFKCLGKQKNLAKFGYDWKIKDVLLGSVSNWK